MEHKKVPTPMIWSFDEKTRAKKKYLRDLDFIHEHTEVDIIELSTGYGVAVSKYTSFHDDLKEVVEHAHELGIRIVLRNRMVPGFFNEEPYIMESPEDAQGLVSDSEGTVDEDGYFTFTQHAEWARPKIRPLWNRVVKVYCFEKTGDGFYRPGTVQDITDRVRVIGQSSDWITAEVNAGKECAGMHIFAMTVQFYNAPECFGDGAFETYRREMDRVSDIPLDGYCMDESGYMVLDFPRNHPGESFRKRLYSDAQVSYFEKTYGCSLDRLMFDMRYAPEGNDAVRIRAINTYFDAVRRQPVRIEYQVADYAKKLFGDDIFLTCHNTFHNNLDNDEIWKTGCMWWDLPRDFGHTDENITFPVRMGISLAAPEPICIDMFYHKEQEPYYRHIVEGAPFCCREFHHCFNDGVWGQGFDDLEFLKNIRVLDRAMKRLDTFQTERPKFDLLIVFGSSAQMNWYPDTEARNLWDVDGKMKVLDKCKTIWDAGYRCALVPDYAVSDGRLKIDGNGVSFCSVHFSHMLFLYPKYAKKEVYAFLNEADKNGTAMAVIGRADIDFDAEPASVTCPQYDEFSLSILKDMNCPNSGISGGCIYADGSFALVSMGLLTGEEQAFDFVADGKRITGTHTGMLAYPEGEPLIATAGSKLWIDGKPVVQ